MGSQLKKEIAVMKLIKHPNVVTVREVFATTVKIFIVMEFVRGGELSDLWTSRSSGEGGLSEPQARFYFLQLLHGLEFCHSKGVCHRDLKPEVQKQTRGIVNAMSASAMSAGMWCRI